MFRNTSLTKMGDEADDESSSDESTLEEEEEVQLGFVEKPKEGPLLFEQPRWRDWDGGVAGGQPVWLGPRPREDVKCDVCKRRCRFVMEIYAPLEDDAFHRALYVFWCPQCITRTMVLRRQLPRRNKYYSEDGTMLSEETSRKVPTICDERFEVVVDAEPDEEVLPTTAAVVEGSDPTTQEAINDAAGAPPPDATTLRFLTRVAREPAQILRYCRGGRPLWISRRGLRTRQNIQPCPRCGGPRSFEFQIMPQLLHFLGVDRSGGCFFFFYFGTIVFYTCDASCHLSDDPLDDHPHLEPLAFRRPH